MTLVHPCSAQITLHFLQRKSDDKERDYKKRSRNRPHEKKKKTKRPSISERKPRIFVETLPARERDSSCKPRYRARVYSIRWNGSVGKQEERSKMRGSLQGRDHTYVKLLSKSNSTVEQDSRSPKKFPSLPTNQTICKRFIFAS